MRRATGPLDAAPAGSTCSAFLAVVACYGKVHDASLKASGPSQHPPRAAANGGSSGSSRALASKSQTPSTSETLKVVSARKVWTLASARHIGGPTGQHKTHAQPWRWAHAQGVARRRAAHRGSSKSLIACETGPKQHTHPYYLYPYSLHLSSSLLTPLLLPSHRLARAAART